MEDILIPILALGGLGLVFGLGLSIASNVFSVEIDPKIEAIDKALPGANCGACGFPGCAGLAEAIANGESPTDACPVGGASTAEAINEIMGVSGETSSDKQVARVICKGVDCNTKDKFKYEGITDCRAAAMIDGGEKSCSYGCLGYGTCVTACLFDAITIVDGIADIDPDKCTSCGKCFEVCPKDVIAWVPYEQDVFIDCNSNDFGKVVKDACSVGCIGCQICVKACPFNAIDFEDGLAVINYEKCTNCGICVDKCPTKSINNEAGDKKKQIAIIDDDLCIGCTICMKQCPVDAIEGELKGKHTVIEEDCIGCGVCEVKCPKDAITMVDAED